MINIDIDYRARKIPWFLVPRCRIAPDRQHHLLHMKDKRGIDIHEEGL